MPSGMEAGPVIGGTDFQQDPVGAIVVIPRKCTDLPMVY